MAQTRISPVVESGVTLIESTQSAKICAAADEERLASAAHAFSCRVAPDRRGVSVILSLSQCRPVIRNVERSGRVALVACHIRSFQTVQVKGENAVIVAATDADRQAALEYCVEFGRYADSLGYPLAVMNAHMSCEPRDAIVLRFSPCSVFDQTPGPAAGRPLAEPG
jgi:hypothetical protein